MTNRKNPQTHRLVELLCKNLSEEGLSSSEIIELKYLNGEISEDDYYSSKSIDAFNMVKILLDSGIIFPWIVFLFYHWNAFSPLVKTVSMWVGVFIPLFNATFLGIVARPQKFPDFIIKKLNYTDYEKGNQLAKIIMESSFVFFGMGVFLIYKNWSGNEWYGVVGWSVAMFLPLLWGSISILTGAFTGWFTIQRRVLERTTSDVILLVGYILIFIPTWYIISWIIMRFAIT